MKCTLYHLSAAAIGLALAGCSGHAAVTPLTPEAAYVTVGNDNPPVGYVEIGPVLAVDGYGCGLLGAKGTYQGVYNLLKNEAAARGASYVQVLSVEGPHMEGDCFDNEYVIRAVAYRQRKGGE